MVLNDEQVRVIMAETGQPGILVRSVERLAGLCGDFTAADLIGKLSARAEREGHPSLATRGPEAAEPEAD